MYHNVFRYEYLTFQKQIHLHKQYIFDTNNIQIEYAFLFPFSICIKQNVLSDNKEHCITIPLFEDIFNYFQPSSIM